MAATVTEAAVAIKIHDSSGHITGVHNGNVNYYGKIRVYPILSYMQS